MRLWTPRWAMFGLIRKTEPDRRFRRSDDWRKFFRAATFIISSGVPEVSENWVCLQIEHEAKSGKCSGRGFQTARLIMPFSLDLTVPGNSQSKISGPKSKTAFICAMTQMIPSDFNGLQIIIGLVLGYLLSQAGPAESRLLQELFDINQKANPRLYEAVRSGLKQWFGFSDTETVDDQILWDRVAEEFRKSAAQTRTELFDEARLTGGGRWPGHGTKGARFRLNRPLRQMRR